MPSALASGGGTRWLATPNPFGIICVSGARLGRHGVWGGLLEVERVAVRKHWLAGVSVVRLLVRGQESQRPAEAEDETHNI
jgi:hypothetical protein